MYSRNLFVLDFVRNFLSIVPKFFEAYAVRAAGGKSATKASARKTLRTKRGF